MILSSRDLRVQLAVALGLFACALAASLESLALVLIAAEGLLLTAGWRGQRTMLLAAMTAAPFVVLNGVLLGPTPFAALGPVTLHREGIEAGLGFAGRGLVALAAAMWVAQNARARDVLRALRRWPSLALAATASLRFAPLAAQDWSQIREAQAMRGHRLANGIRGSLGAAPLLVPLLVGTVRRGHTLQEAIEASAFGSGPRTAYPAPKLARPDVVLLGLALLLFGVTAWLVARGVLA
jgi:energy-coupling factor transporter transmembrane protein EcfT